MVYNKILASSFFALGLLTSGVSFADRSEDLINAIGHIPHKSGKQYLKDAKEKERRDRAIWKEHADCEKSWNCIVREVGDTYYYYRW